MNMLSTGTLVVAIPLLMKIMTSQEGGALFNSRVVIRVLVLATIGVLIYFFAEAPVIPV